MKMTRGKGVLSKDGKTPFAAGTLHYSRVDENGHSWKSPADYSMTNLANAFVALSKGEIDEIQLIDKDNTQTIIKRTVAEDRLLLKGK